MSDDYYSKRLIEPKELNVLLNEHQDDDSDFLPVFVGAIESFAQAHVPQSMLIAPRQLVSGMAPAAGKIADEDDLVSLFQHLGITPNTTIIAYDDEGGGWAGRLIWTLDVIGHNNYLILNGGIHAWHADGFAIASGTENIPQRPSSDYSFTIDHKLIPTFNDIITSLENGHVRIWDARSREEHSGERVLAARGGRIPGARNVDWLELIDRTNAMRLKPHGDIEQLLQERGLDPAQPGAVITHCHSHHRSGLTYLVGKLFGLDIKAYDGSWSEWGNLADTPIETDS